MEFVNYGEAISLLKRQGIREREDSPERTSLELHVPDGVSHLHIAAEGCSLSPENGARVKSIARDQLAPTLEHLIKKLNLREVLLVPVAKWRKIFDAVAFSLASNEDWQEVDAAATVELNTRDPLLCEPADVHTLQALIAALLNDAEGPDQGLCLTTTSSPLMIEFIPEGALRISVGNPALADQVAQTLGL